MNILLMATFSYAGMGPYVCKIFNEFSHDNIYGFFIDDQQTEVLELHVFGQQTMGADQDIDFSFLHLPQDLFLPASKKGP